MLVENSIIKYLNHWNQIFVYLFLDLKEGRYKKAFFKYIGVLTTVTVELTDQMLKK
jgi:hypothetical protein